MTDTFNALVIRDSPAGQSTSIEELSDADLPDGEVLVDIDYSSLNYKDGMALAGKGRIIRSFPMVPGIDLRAPFVSRLRIASPSGTTSS